MDMFEKVKPEDRPHFGSNADTPSGYYPLETLMVSLVKTSYMMAQTGSTFTDCFYSLVFYIFNR